MISIYDVYIADSKIMRRSMTHFLHTGASSHADLIQDYFLLMRTYVSVAEVGSLSGKQKISQTFGERAFAKFRDKNAVFVNFCDKTLYL